MKILFLVPYAPTPIRTRPYNLLRGLLRQGHELTLATVWENETEHNVLTEFARTGAQVLSAPLSKPRIAQNLAAALFSNLPLQAKYSWQPEVVKQVYANFYDTANTNRISPNFDVIHIEHLRGAIFGLQLRLKQAKNLASSTRFQRESASPPYVWDSVDNISALFEQAARNGISKIGRWIMRFEIPRTRRYEANLIDQFHRTLVTSPVDRAAFTKLHGEEKSRYHPSRDLPIDILTNGVDFDVFKPSGAAYQQDLIIFSGKLSYHANVSAAVYLVEQVMPLVWARRPQTRVLLAGKDPHPVLLGLSKENHRVEVTGTVPDLPSYLQRAAVAAATITYGAGVQNKVLEAMACATPVVATSKAVSALKARPGYDILVADDPGGLAAHLLCLLEDEQIRQTIAQNSLEYVRCNHHWNTITTQLVTIYENIVNSAS